MELDSISSNSIQSTRASSSSSSSSDSDSTDSDISHAQNPCLLTLAGLYHEGSPNLAPLASEPYLPVSPINITPPTVIHISIPQTHHLFHKVTKNTLRITTRTLHYIIGYSIPTYSFRQNLKQNPLPTL